MIYAVRPNGTNEVWQIVNAPDPLGAARVAAKRCKSEPAKRGKPLPVKLPKAWDVASVKSDEHLGSASESLGCVCEGAATLLKMFDTAAATTVRL